VIQNACPKDSGKYTAVVENEMGSVESSCVVEISGEESSELSVGER
jgi:G3E family GTPase